MYFGQSLILRVVWGPTQKFHVQQYICTMQLLLELTVPAAGTLSNLQLYLACETNLDIVNTLKQQMMTSGLRMPIPFVTIVKNGGLGAVTPQTVQITIGTEKGAKIKKIVHSIFNTQESKNTAIDHSNQSYAAGGVSKTYKLLHHSG